MPTRRSFAVLLVVAACDPYGSNDAPPSDAGSVPAEASVADTGADAGADTTEPACPRSFDEKFDLLPPWEKATRGGDVSVSGGRLIATVTPTSSSGEAQIRIEVPGMGAKSARLAFETQILEYSGAGEVTIGCSLRLDHDDGTNVELGVYVFDGQINADDVTYVDGIETTTDPGTAVALVDLAKVHAVDIAARSITDTSAHATFIVDGKTIFERDVALPKPIQRFVVKCGIDYAAEGVAAKVAVDDATLDVCR